MLAVAQAGDIELFGFWQLYVLQLGGAVDEHIFAGLRLASSNNGALMIRNFHLHDFGQLAG